MTPPRSSSVRSVVTSSDGARIAVDTAGSGPGVLLVSGMLVPPGGYDSLVGLLARNLTVHYHHRRGRGDSPVQADSYCIEQEVEDVDAVLEATGASMVIGHSYGGLIALQAALHRPGRISRLALYEPAISIDGQPSLEFLGPFEQALARGRHALALTLLQRGIEVAGPMARLPRAAHRLLNAALLATVMPALRGTLATVPAETREATGALAGRLDRYRPVDVPALVMIGGSSAPWLRNAGRSVAAALPGATLRDMPGLNHDTPLIKAAAVAGPMRDFLCPATSERTSP